jgi:glycosyltransferase involved in cell wall biosynthesis
MTSFAEPSARCLVATPAYNEEATIGTVIERVRASLPEFDLLVVDDGSRDATGRVLRRLGVTTAPHLSNLGYGRAIQTAVQYAVEFDYELLITLDADGQHQPEQVRALYRESLKGGWDLLIGSRFVETRNYGHSPLGRRIGMQVFSVMIRLITGRSIYDTTSGLKLITRRAFPPLLHWHFVDFHAQAVVYLLRLGYRVGEFPISVAERAHGESMYSAISHVTYPLKTALMVMLGMVQAELTRRRSRQ